MKVIYVDFKFMSDLKDIDLEVDWVEVAEEMKEKESE